MPHTAVQKHPAVATFAEFPFRDTLHRDIVAAGFQTPTPIQARCILPALEGSDIIGLAQTGTGKTAAFALPIIHQQAGRPDLGALVLAPTRELVHQIVEVFRKLSRSSDIRVASLVGGVKVSHDHKALRSRPNVLVATPGRLLDHIDRRTVSLKGVAMLVVDEADRMHDMGFMPQIRRILAALPTERQTLMFTATMPDDVEQVARRHMRDPIKISVGAVSKPVERAIQKLYDVQEPHKMSLLLDILKQETGRVLVFVRTKRRVDRLAKRISNYDYNVARLHGDREQRQRDEAMAGFRDGRYRILFATDIAARGLDVADIEHVINFDFPRSPEDYVHRIGRTARLAGKASSFVTPEDRSYVRDLDRHLGTKLVLTTAPGSKARSDSDPVESFRTPHQRRPHTPASERGRPTHHREGQPSYAGGQASHGNSYSGSHSTHGSGHASHAGAHGSHGGAPASHGGAHGSHASSGQQGGGGSRRRRSGRGSSAAPGHAAHGSGQGSHSSHGSSGHSAGHPAKPSGHSSYRGYR